ncbi:MAG: sigma-70 family RNA polymerase sigma factor [Cyclobacteriaceae bacterium]
MLKDQTKCIDAHISLDIVQMQDEVSDRYNDKTDLEVWQAMNRGDEEALIYIYNTYVHKLLRFGIQFAPREVVKDSIQDLFFYLKKRTRSKLNVQRISPYLYKALFRIISTKQEYSKNFLSEKELVEVKDWHINVSDEIKLIERESQEERSERLKKSLRELSRKQRQAILLYYYEGFTHNEITDIMGLKNKSSVRKLIHRAIDSLKNNFLP